MTEKIKGLEVDLEIQENKQTPTKKTVDALNNYLSKPFSDRRSRVSASRVAE